MIMKMNVYGRWHGFVEEYLVALKLGQRTPTGLSRALLAQLIIAK